MNILKNTIIGSLCGVLFISVFYWSTILTFIASKVGGFSTSSVVFICALLTNVLIGFLLAADRYRNILYKWLISIPMGIITFFIYREINFIYYWINRIWPGYGNLSAGGGFAVLFYLAIFCLCFVIAIVIAILLTKRNLKRTNTEKESTIAL